jgi:5'-nucleotidase
MPAIGLFDLDGSLADHDASLLRDLRSVAGTDEPPIDDIWCLDKIPFMKARIDLIRSQPGWWFNLKPIVEGLMVFHAAEKIGFCNHILTKGPKTKPLAWKEKVEWCHKHLGEDHPVHITMDKGMVYGKFLYDDYPEYMLRWLKYRPRGLGIMPVRPNNKDFQHPNVLMYNGNLGEVIVALEQCYRRKSGDPLKPV